DREVVKIARTVVDFPATEQVLLAGKYVGHVAEGASAIRQIELPARGMGYRARIPQSVTAFDQRRAAVGVAQRPVFMKPADVADLPEHGIDDVQARAHQFGR